MSTRRFPRLRALLVPILSLTWFSVPIHPASAIPATFDRAVEVAVGTVIQPLVLPVPTNIIAASVPLGQRPPKVSIRLADGRWSPLHFDGDHRPDARERGIRALSADQQRRFSDPQWLGTATEIELRASAPARIRLHLINSTGEPLGFVSGLWRALTVPRRAEAAVPDQRIITRAQWGADESWVDGPPGPADELKAFFVHHTASGNGYRKSDVPAIIRGIYRYHTATQGWSDIGYNFLIDRFGRMFEGRAGSIYDPMIGAHARGANEGTAGVSLIGDFTRARVPDAMRTSLIRLIAWKADVHHVPLGGTTILPGGDTYKRINGHRDANSTACPGANAYNLLPGVRRAARTFGGAKFFEPRSSGDLLRPDGDGIADVWRLNAWGNRSMTWTLEFADAVGTVRRTLSVTGARLETGGAPGVTWDGRDELNMLVPSGRYSWTLRARDASGQSARPATGSLLVITDHLDGTALSDDAGSYLVEDGTARTVPALAARTLYARRGIIATGSAERARYTTAPLSSVPPRQGALVRTPAGELLIVASATEVRAFSPSTIATTLGYRAKNAITVTDADLTGTARGAPITTSDRHPVGAFVRDGADIYRIRAVDRIHVSPFVVGAMSATAEVVDATLADLAMPIAAGTLEAPNGAIAWRNLSWPKPDRYWLISDGQRRLILDTSLFSAYGPWLGGIVAAEYSDLADLPIGPPIR